jgi:nicotinate-nucleotide adenylyltransferase
LIGLFGGTFDPIHLGHLHAADTALNVLDLDCLRLVLSARPSHRQAPIASAEHRWTMLQLAVADRARLIADDTELRRSEPSYTVVTLEDLRSRIGERESLAWLIGWDAYQDLPTWFRWREMLELTHLVVVRRPGQGRPLEGTIEAFSRAHYAPALEALHAEPAGCVHFMTSPMLDISASEIRNALAAGRDVADLLPPAVWAYIRQRELYRS